MVSGMILVDEWRIWIPDDKAKLHTASKIIRWISFWVGVLEIEGDVIDIIAIREEEDAPNYVSHRYPQFYELKRVLPRVTGGFKNRAMISPWMIPPVIYLPVVYLCLEDRRLF